MASLPRHPCRDSRASPPGHVCRGTGASLPWYLCRRTGVSLLGYLCQGTGTSQLVTPPGHPCLDIPTGAPGNLGQHPCQGNRAPLPRRACWRTGTSLPGQFAEALTSSHQHPHRGAGAPQPRCPAGVLGVAQQCPCLGSLPVVRASLPWGCAVALGQFCPCTPFRAPQPPTPWGNKGVTAWVLHVH